MRRAAAGSTARSDRRLGLELDREDATVLKKDTASLAVDTLDVEILRESSQLVQ